MEEHALPWGALAWFAGWFVATAAIFVLGLSLPAMRKPNGRAQGRHLFAWSFIAVAVGVIANIALSFHDAHIDLTREKIFTPAAAALAVIDRLQAPVKILYFFRGDDPDGRRARDILSVMQRRNSRLDVHAVDPDSDPEIAANYGVKIYNTAVIEAQGRQIMVRSTDETEIAIGIQRVLRERLVVVCFAEGHGEYASTNYEFHSHLEGAVGHSHDASSAVVDTAAHGFGRFRRSLEGLGYEVQVIGLARPGGIPPECNLVIDAGPRTTFLPAESDALREYSRRGGSLLLMFEPGFVIDAKLAAFLAQLGVQLPATIVIDKASHYGQDASQVAMTGYASHPITRDISYTFFPGIRGLTLVATTKRVKVSPLMTSSATSTAHPFASNTSMSTASSTGPTDARPQVLAAAIEGTLDAQSDKPFRSIVIGDADFASNSYYPYVANSALVLSMARWLLREDSQVAIASRIPVPEALVLTKSQQLAVFMLIEVAVPLMVALIGVWIWWRRR